MRQLLPSKEPALASLAFDHLQADFDASAALKYGPSDDLRKKLRLD
jgi:hypothetical protein